MAPASPLPHPPFMEDDGFRDFPITSLVLGDPRALVLGRPAAVGRAAAPNAVSGATCSLGRQAFVARRDGHGHGRRLSSPSVRSWPACCLCRPRCSPCQDSPGNCRSGPLVGARRWCASCRRPMWPRRVVRAKTLRFKAWPCHSLTRMGPWRPCRSRRQQRSRPPRLQWRNPRHLRARHLCCAREKARLPPRRLGARAKAAGARRLNPSCSRPRRGRPARRPRRGRTLRIVVGRRSCHAVSSPGARFGRASQGQATSRSRKRAHRDHAGQQACRVRRSAHAHAAAVPRRRSPSRGRHDPLHRRPPGEGLHIRQGVQP